MNRHPRLPLACTRGLLRITTLTAAALALFLSGAAPARAQAPAPVRNPALGVVHVDLMDLHVTRLPDAPPTERSVLSEAELGERYRRAVDLGAGWHRWSIYWDLVDRAGADPWGVPDGIVARDARHGLSSLVVLQGNQPGLVHQSGAPEGLEHPPFLDPAGAATEDPERAAGINPGNHWARFVNAAVERYRPGGGLAQAGSAPPGAAVRAWQIGNEPNLLGFWRGSPADYARLLEVSALVIRRLDPGATIVHAGIADDGNAADWYGRFADALAARAAASPLPARYGHYFDAAAWHWYRAPGLLATGPGQARAILAARGIPAKPLWITELGIPIHAEAPGPCWDPASPGRVTLAEQAGFAWQALAEALALGAERVFYFQLYDDCGNGPASYDAFGLLRNHAGNRCWTPPDRGCWSLDPARAGSPRPAYEALRLAARELAGARPAGPPVDGGGWRRAVFNRADGARVTVAWSLGPPVAGAGIPAAAGGTRYSLDAEGNIQSSRLAPAGGTHAISLTAANGRNAIAGRPVIFGMPVLLVEGGGAAVAGSLPGGPGAPAAGPAAPDRGSSAPAGPGAGAAGGADRVPPMAAQVAVLPAESEPRFTLTVIAADESSALDAWVVYVARGPQAPADPGAWQVLEARSWPDKPRVGQVQIPFEGRPGEVWHFAAQAGDTAGNWTPFPGAPQASTRIGLARPRAVGRGTEGIIPH